MKLLLILLFGATLLFSSTEFEQAYKAYKLGNYKSSLETFKTLANEKDDYDAAYILGYMYEHGEGCEIDLQESQKWYKLSSNGYYWQIKKDPTRDVAKKHRLFYNTISKPENQETQNTIQQYTQSLYNIKAHEANYFLPMSYRYGDSYVAPEGKKSQQVEMEFQVSIKFDFAANVFNLNEIYTVAYTQKSYWQFYTSSAYFRESNYNPELFVTIPMSQTDETSFIKAFRFSFAHQSNGRGNEEERAWDYIAATMYTQYKSLFTELKLWLPIGSLKYNEDLMDYMGYGHLKFILPYQKHLVDLTLRSNFSGEHAAELNYTYPAFGRDDLFFYVKGFSGYGESLIDYDNSVNKIGFGFSISR